ncbi:MAG: hypothetical protein ABII74_01690 [Elusimicrobiota bacterium]
MGLPFPFNWAKSPKEKEKIAEQRAVVILKFKGKRNKKGIETQGKKTKATFKKELASRNLYWITA